MKAKQMIAGALLCGTFFGLGWAGGQEGEAPSGMDAKAMEAAMALAGPGDEHEGLAKWAGEWEMEVSMNSPMPGMPEQKQTGKASAKMILGGRFLEVTSNGSFFGQPFESKTILGYDRRHGKYTLVGFDTLGTYWVAAEGVRDEDGVIRMHGTDDDPMGEQVFTFEYREIGEDEYEHRVLFERIGDQVFEEPLAMVTVRNRRK